MQLIENVIRREQARTSPASLTLLLFIRMRIVCHPQDPIYDHLLMAVVVAHLS